MSRAARSSGRSVRWKGLVALGASCLAALLLVPAAGTVAAAAPNALLAGAAVPNPYATGQAASLVLGQTAFNQNGCGVTNSTLELPSAVAFDAAGDLWVADGGNNRILEFTPPFRSGMGASLVLGQATFLTATAGTTQTTLADPEALAFDAAGDLWVADRANSRVLEFVPPFSDGMDASVVLGQQSFTTGTTGTSASDLSAPYGLAVAPNGDLFVADTFNYRVLEYTPPFTSGMNASLVIGQTSLTGASAGSNASKFTIPTSVAFGPGGQLFVADYGNHRVLAFDPPFATGMSASVVLGETTFTNTVGTESASNFTNPFGIAVSASGDVWVSDYVYHRALEFVPPLSNGQKASVVLGQAAFNASVNGDGSRQADQPWGLTLGPTGNLWEVDMLGCRVVEYIPSAFTVRVVESGLASGTLWSAVIGGTGAASSNASLAVLLENGSYAYQIGSVAGYLLTPSSGSVVVNGSTATVLVHFAPAIAGVPPAEFALAVLAPILAAAVGVSVFVLRGRGRPPRRGVQPAPPAAAPPSEAPPPGAAQ